VRLGKSKCGATVCWLVGGVAPLLILLKRWLYFSFVCPFNVSTVGRHRVTHNLLICTPFLKKGVHIQQKLVGFVYLLKKWVRFIFILQLRYFN